MTQKYEIEAVENGYLVKFTGSSIAAHPETYVFPTFVGLVAFMSERVKWIEKSGDRNRAPDDRQTQGCSHA